MGDNANGGVGDGLDNVQPLVGTTPPSPDKVQPSPTEGASDDSDSNGTPHASHTSQSIPSLD